VSKYDSEVGFWRDLIRQGKVPDSPDGRCLAHLLLPADYFRGMRVLEVGPGPLRWATDFTDCQLWGIDPLLYVYASLGYDLGPAFLLKAHAEDMPFPDDFFDAVISFNAIDHVDDFEQAIKEIERVCKPDGIIRIECHYHEAWECEPMVLDDKRVRKAFSKGVKKLIERPYGETFFPGNDGSLSYQGTVALWSNEEYMG
jgi:ubiquinone/menaquinone biosynthesis C-methylase UbiE